MRSSAALGLPKDLAGKLGLAERDMERLEQGTYSDAAGTTTRRRLPAKATMRRDDAATGFTESHEGLMQVLSQVPSPANSLGRDIMGIPSNIWVGGI